MRYDGAFFILCCLRCYQLFFFVKVVAPSSAAGRWRRAWSESDDDDEPLQRGPESSPVRENSVELQESGEIREDNSKLNRGAAVDDEED